MYNKEIEVFVGLRDANQGFMNLRMARAPIGATRFSRLCAPELSLHNAGAVIREC